MEINVNFVLLEERREKPDGRAEAHIAILRESKDADSALESATPEFDPPN